MCPSGYVQLDIQETPTFNAAQLGAHHPTKRESASLAAPMRFVLLSTATSVSLRDTTAASCAQSEIESASLARPSCFPIDFTFTPSSIFILPSPMPTAAPSPISVFRF